MSMTKKKSKTLARKRSTRPKLRGGKKPTITPEKARRLAERHILDRVFKGAPVRDGAKAPLYIFGFNPAKKCDVWVVYKNSDRTQLAFISSDVILICKHTGKVLYEGSAGDEG